MECCRVFLPMLDLLLEVVVVAEVHRWRDQDWNNCFVRRSRNSFFNDIINIRCVILF